MSIQTLKLPLILPSGEECSRCIARLQSELQLIKGVSRAAVNNARTTITLEYDPDLVTLHRIEMEARQAGAGIAARIEHLTLEMKDLDCPDCANSIEKSVGKVPGVLWAAANFAAGRIHVEFERSQTTVEKVQQVVESHGVRACEISPAGEDSRRDAPTLPRSWEDVFRDNRKMITTVSAAVLAVFAVLLAALGRYHESGVCYTSAVIIGGWSTATSAWMAVRQRSIDMSVLMTVAVLGAVAIGDLFEASTVVVLYNIGTLLQANAVERTRRSMRGLMDLTPRKARVQRGRAEFDVPVEQVRLYETVLVKPGERIPMDGEITRGATSVDESSITGEAMPAPKEAGDKVYAGTLNAEGAFEFRVSHVYRDTLLSRIIHRVEEAQAQRAPAQQIIDRFAKRYTPAVIVLALSVALLPPAGIWAWNHFQAIAAGPDWRDWMLRGLCLLIIACPCALVISTPVAIVTAIGSASRCGVLIKGGAFLEEIGRARAVLYDKTGTLTEGRFRIEDAVPVGDATCAEMLLAAAAIESKSEHPLATAFTAAAAGQPAELPALDAFEALPGRGASALIKGEAWYVGSPRLLADLHLPPNGVQPVIERAEALGKTAVVVIREDTAIGVIIVSDIPRDVGETIRELTALGIEHQAMLTGDNVQVARSVAEAAGLPEYKAGLLPDQKLELVRAYQHRYGCVVMVGDGINDAPALAAANVGVVMGAAGSDTAMETADIALMGDDLRLLPFLIRLSRRTRTIIQQNVAFSLVSKGALIGLAIIAGIPLWLAVVGDVGVSLLVTANALRLVRTA